MAKKHNNDFEDDQEYGSGRFINDGSLFDKHEFEDDEEDDEEEVDDNFNIDDDDEKKSPYEDDLVDEPDEDAEEKPKKKRVNLKPKLIGKHSLSYDTIFKGKQNAAPTEEAEYFPEHIIKNGGGSLDINDGDLESEESRNSIDSFRDLRLKDEVHKLLKIHTDINFVANRRKPAKTDFNAYFGLLLKELVQYGYTRTEIFIELSGYFSDNTWNMFLLLDKQYSNIIIRELKDKYGLSDMDKIDFLSM
jgi:hypothetical protein